MRQIIITQEEYEEVRALAKRNKNKRVDHRLQVILLSYEGMSDKEIAEKLDYHPLRVTQLILISNQNISIIHRLAVICLTV